jgi:hypothetical protein
MNNTLEIGSSYNNSVPSIFTADVNIDFLCDFPSASVAETEENSSMRVKECSGTERTEHSKKNEKRIQRLRGFVQNFSGDEAIVVFVVKNMEDIAEQHTYVLPKHVLVKNKITAVNQPFEMDQVEVEDKDSFYTVQKYRPIADANSFEYESIEFDKEYRDKLSEILTSKD